jgi:hypothetical protein
MAGWRRLGGCILAIAGWAIGLWLAFSSMFLSGFARVTGNEGDPRLINYLLEHGYRWLTGDPAHRSFWNLPIFYPAQNTLAYSDILLSAGPFYWCWRLVGFQPDTAYQLWLVTICSLNYWTTDALLRNCLRLNPLASTLGAFLFAFASSRLSQISHSQLYTHFFTIVAIYALYRLFEAPVGQVSNLPSGQVGRKSAPRAWIIVFGLAAVAQLWASFYLGWFLGLGLLLAGLWALFLRGPRQTLLGVIRAYPVELAFTLAVCGLLLAPLAIHYLEAAREVGQRSYESIEAGLPTPRTWCSMGTGSWLYGWLRPFEPSHVVEGARGEHLMGIGLITTAVAVVGLLRRRASVFPLLLLLAGCSVVALTTNLSPGVSCWRLVHSLVPGAAALRAITRIGLLLLLPASIGVALFVHHCKRSWVAVAVVLLCILEQGRFMETYDKHAVRNRVAALQERIRSDDTAFYYTPLLGEPTTVPNWRWHLDAMQAGLESGVPTVNGYSGNLPPGWADLYEIRLRTEEDEERARSALGRWETEHRLEPGEIRWIRKEE